MWSCRNMSILVFFLILQSSLGFRVLEDNFWKESALDDLYESLEVGYNTKTAKNVILFIGDGMGPNSVTAARIYSQGEEGYLSWERFPHIGGIKTYAADRQVPDSAATATALYTGLKVNRGTLGIDQRVKRKDCHGSKLQENRLTTIAALAQEAGKATGVITTTRATHATPAAMYAHSADRDWECDSKIPAGSGCKDIARQLVEDLPGKKFNIIMGGGRQMLMANPPNRTGDQISNTVCVRTDGRNLISEWTEQKRSEGLRYAVPKNTRDLLNVDVDNTDYLLGIFQNSYLSHEYIRDKSETGVPSLAEMTTTAIKIMKKNQNGFVLMVEGGMIDVAHHHGAARVALEEVLALNHAINSTMKLLRDSGIEDETLVIVTSDHSHTLTISGYPERGNNILGIADISKIDGVPYTTLGYANSVRNNYRYTAVNGTVVREDPSTVDTTAWDYGPQAAVLVDENSHGGNDVFVYATGPFAHLFHRIHEQHYIAVVMRYATRLGEFSGVPSQSPSSSSTLLSSVILITAVLFLYILCVRGHGGNMF